MAATCHGCGAPIYPPRRRWCWRCSDKVHQQREAARWQAMTPDEREARRQDQRLKYAAERPERVCCRCRAHIRTTWSWTCDRCCGKRNLQKRLAERARRARMKATT